jgi:ABC-type transporter Mla subunit MlaD|tara:strand:+ start:467 stop:1084 length:618 start_codon:yes stop_codon:yes gene_type:complete
MNIALIIASIANPVITGLLTILFFLESKKSKKQIESIQNSLNNVQKEVVSTVISSSDQIKNSIDKQKDDFTKLADRLELLSRDTEESAKNFVEISDALTKSSAVSKEALGNVTSGLENHANLVSGLVTELTQKVSQTSADSIKDLSTQIVSSLKSVNDSVEKIETSQEKLNSSLSSAINDLSAKTEKTTDSIKSLKETLNSTVSL